MSDEKKAEKREFTKEYVEQQLISTGQRVNALQDELQQELGTLNYLRFLQREFNLPSAPKPVDPTPPEVV